MFEIILTTTEEYREAYNYLYNKANAKEKRELDKLRIDSVFNSENGHRTVDANVCAVAMKDGYPIGFEAISITKGRKGWERSMFIAEEGRGYRLAPLMMEICGLYVSEITPGFKFIYSHGGTRTTDYLYQNIFKMEASSWKVLSEGKPRAGVFKRTDKFIERFNEFYAESMNRADSLIKIMLDPNLYIRLKEKGYKVDGSTFKPTSGI